MMFDMTMLIWNASPTAVYVCIVRPNWAGWVSLQQEREYFTN